MALLQQKTTYSDEKRTRFNYGRIPKFSASKTDKFQDWRMRVKKTLYIKGLSDVVTGIDSDPAATIETLGTPN